MIKDFTSQWYSVRMFLVGKLLHIFGVVLIINQKGVTDAVTLILVLQYTHDTHWIQSFLESYMSLDRSLLSAQRFLDLEKVPQEKYNGTQEVDSAAWPQSGQVEFKDVELRYRDNTPLVLHQLSFKVEGGSKVGIVGRTGAGKSTMAQALSRIVEVENGSIEIDSCDISQIGLTHLRDKITVIPQDPTLFTGSLRYNIDPLGLESDETIKELVRKAGLEEATTKKKTRGRGRKNNKTDKTDDGKNGEITLTDEQNETGIYFQIRENGNNLSVGERQLVCFCRAITRKNKVVILDEATANIDIVTEQKIQKLISEEFEGATVLTIAHRLNTVIQSDKVLVLDNGICLEYDTPQNLMKDSNSHFSSLLKELKKDTK